MSRNRRHYVSRLLGKVSHQLFPPSCNSDSTINDFNHEPTAISRVFTFVIFNTSLGIRNFLKEYFTDIWYVSVISMSRILKWSILNCFRIFFANLYNLLHWIYFSQRLSNLDYYILMNPLILNCSIGCARDLE